MGAQKRKKKLLAEMFCILNVYYPKTYLIKVFNSLDSSRPYERLLENHKTGGSRELFVPENCFQTSSTKHFPKNIQILEAWKPTEDMKFMIFFSHAPLHMNSI